MAIQIVNPPDPLSKASLEDYSRLILAESDASRSLRRLTRQFVEGELCGQSVLIAGHRGAGKSTLVYSVYRQMLEVYDRGLLKNRPLLVRCHALKLLPVEDRGQAQATASDSVDGQSANSRSAFSEATESQKILMQIVVDLYRAVIEDTNELFSRRLENKTDQLLALGQMHTRRLTTVMASVSQLVHEFDSHPTVDRLTQFWRAARLFETGGLLNRLPHRRFDLKSGYTRKQLIEAASQPSRELTALATSCEMYLRVSGELFATRDEKDAQKKQEEKDEQKKEKAQKLQDLLAAGLTTAIGALAGTGGTTLKFWSQYQGLIGGVLAGLLAALAMRLWSPNWSGSARRQDFVADLTLETLPRELPKWIYRLRDAGFAPIFVIDELDKLEDSDSSSAPPADKDCPNDAFNRIAAMSNRFKQLFGEQALFCFVADRSFFEKMAQRARSSPYPVSYTWFGHALYISFRPTDLRTYLHQRIRRDVQRRRGSAAPYRAAALLSAAVSDDFEEGPEDLEEREDLAVIPSIVLYRARMHMTDIQRVLLSLQDADGRIRFGLGTVRERPIYRFQRQLQDLIEQEFERPEIQDRIDQDPAFIQTAYDAMYYLPRIWEGEKVEGVDDDGAFTLTEKNFCAYLDRRAGLNG